MLKCINVTLMWYPVKDYAFPLVEINGRQGRAFFGLLPVTTLEHWGVDNAYLNIISTNFQQDPYSYFSV